MKAASTSGPQTLSSSVGESRFSAITGVRCVDFPYGSETFLLFLNDPLRSGVESD